MQLPEKRKPTESSPTADLNQKHVISLVDYCANKTLKCAFRYFIRQIEGWVGPKELRDDTLGSPALSKHHQRVWTSAWARREHKLKAVWRVDVVERFTAAFNKDVPFPVDCYFVENFLGKADDLALGLFGHERHVSGHVWVFEQCVLYFAHVEGRVR